MGNVWIAGWRFRIVKMPQPVKLTFPDFPIPLRARKEICRPARDPRFEIPDEKLLADEVGEPLESSGISMDYPPFASLQFRFDFDVR